MKKCLILPYFGKFPNFFDLFLKSCFYNKDVDFLFLTDQDCPVNEPNLHFIKMSWQEMVSHVRGRLGNDIELGRPYKLCDYKPAYGFIFQKYIGDYDYWGHCDCDLIFGNLELLNPYFEAGYERIGEYGHLIFYKNIEKVNLYFQTLAEKGVPTWETVSHSPKSFCFDEHGGMNTLCQANHIFTAQPRLFDDIMFYRKNFYSRRLIGGKIDNPRIPVYYEFENGRLFRHYFLKGKWGMDESLYVHFQKRKMNVDNTMELDHFFMIPNQFLSSLPAENATVVRACSAPLLDFKYLKIMTKHIVKTCLMRLKKFKGTSIN